MNERTLKAAAFLLFSGSISVLRAVPAIDDAANAPAIAWVPEVTVGLLWGVLGIVGALGELSGSDVDHRDGVHVRSYAWGFASLLVAILIVGLAFSYLTGDFVRFVSETAGSIAGLVALAYFTTRVR